MMTSVAEATAPSGSVSPDTTAPSSERPPVESKAEDRLFTLLNLDPHDANDKEMLEKERTAIWAKVELLMDLHPSAFRRKYKFKIWKEEVHPLGMICVLKASEDLINTAYEVFPEAANDAFALACSFNVDLEVIKWLYNKAPEAVKWKGPENNLPLHVVIIEETCLRTVEFIYQAYPAASMCKDENGCTPLHYAFVYSSLAIVKFLVGKSKADAVQMENNCKMTPLHIAFLNDKHQVPDFLATKYPDFLKKPRSSDGWLPLHFACHHATSIVGVQVLLEHYPDAVKQKDKQGKIPVALVLHENAKLQEEDLLELIELLVRYYPEAIDVEDNDGNKAIDVDTQGRLLKHVMAKQPPAKKQKT